MFIYQVESGKGKSVGGVATLINQQGDDRGVGAHQRCKRGQAKAKRAEVAPIAMKLVSREAAATAKFGCATAKTDEVYHWQVARKVVVADKIENYESAWEGIVRDRGNHRNHHHVQNHHEKESKETEDCGCKQRLVV